MGVYHHDGGRALGELLERPCQGGSGGRGQFGEGGGGGELCRVCV